MSLTDTDKMHSCAPNWKRTKNSLNKSNVKWVVCDVWWSVCVRNFLSISKSSKCTTLIGRILWHFHSHKVTPLLIVEIISTPDESVQHQIQKPNVCVKPNAFADDSLSWCVNWARNNRSSKQISKPFYWWYKLLLLHLKAWVIPKSLCTFLKLRYFCNHLYLAHWKMHFLHKLSTFLSLPEILDSPRRSFLLYRWEVMIIHATWSDSWWMSVSLASPIILLLTMHSLTSFRRELEILGVFQDWSLTKSTSASLSYLP